MGSINFSQKIFASILFQIFPGANIGEIINFGIKFCSILISENNFRSTSVTKLFLKKVFYSNHLNLASSQSGNLDMTYCLIHFFY